MKSRFALVAAAVLALGTLAAHAQQAPAAAPDPIVATIDARQTAPPVSNYVFGMFIEHIAKTMYSSIWAEMLDDRKFYFPILSKDKEPKPEHESIFPGMTTRKWRPVGPGDAVTMDKTAPFVGDQTPRIALDTKSPHGIRQEGLALVNGKKYTGHIVVKASAGARVSVALVWGSGDKDRQTVALGPLTAVYKTIPFSFTAQADSSNAAFEIAGAGSGDLHIGAVSLMPADNIDGFRPDTVALIKQIHSGFWRFGGNYTSNYTWYNAIGDRDRRPPEWDFAWNAMQTNDLGMDEFAEFCKLIDVEPYISVNAGLGDAHSAAEQVEYMNGPVTSRMGALRAKNGHPAPYHIQFWNIGNEPWGSWQIGRTDPKYFFQKHNDFAKAMRQVDPSIVLIASGEMLEDGNLPNDMRAKFIGNLGPVYGTDPDWTGGFLKYCWGNLDGVAEHWYASPGTHFDLDKARNLPLDKPTDSANVKIDQSLLDYARYPANIVRIKAEEWQGYQQRFPAMLQKKTFLSIDEYAYFGGDFGKPTALKNALAYGMTFNEMLRHTDFLTMAAHTMGTSTIDYNATSSTLNTLGLVFKLYSNTFPGAIPVAVGGNSPQPAPKYPVGGDQPHVNSGSPTYPLDLYAALSPDRKSLLVAVVNATESTQKLDLNLEGAQLGGSATQWLITADSLNAVNQVGKAPQVQLKEIPLAAAPRSIAVAPISISVYRFALAK